MKKVIVLTLLYIQTLSCANKKNPAASRPLITIPENSALIGAVDACMEKEKSSQALKAQEQIPKVPSLKPCYDVVTDGVSFSWNCSAIDWWNQNYDFEKPQDYPILKDLLREPGKNIDTVKKIYYGLKELEKNATIPFKERRELGTKEREARKLEKEKQRIAEEEQNAKAAQAAARVAIQTSAAQSMPKKTTSCCKQCREYCVIL